MKRALILAALLAWTAPVAASVVERGYLPLADGTLLNYTLTRPSAEGRFPVVLQYDPYSAGTTSDPTWNEAGYAMLGVNIRGTGCSQGHFLPLRADLWGAEGAQVVDWIAAQAWSDGSVGMIGYSFTGTSQLATAAFAGAALKAITPGNVFPDLYRDIIYPGGVFNQWLPAWILAGRAFVGSPTLDETASEPDCAVNVLRQTAPNVVQTPDLALHPHLDEYWALQPASLLERVRLPVLGCVNWQDTTVYSRAADMFRESLNRDLTWMVGGNGAHADCPVSRARLVQFFDRYLKGLDNAWEQNPHVLLVHEAAGVSSVREPLTEDVGAWRSGYAQWADFENAIKPLSLHFHPGGRLGLEPPAQAASESYRYPLPSANTPADWMGQSPWTQAVPPGGALSYTTPVLAQDAEFAGSGSVNLWFESTAAEVDMQVTLSEIRPDGQELFVQNGWLRLTHRKLDAARSTPLRPWHTHLESDAAALPAGEAVPVRIELQPFNHVFRAGSALRLTVDAPGSWMRPAAAPATNSLLLGPERGSELVLGWIAEGRAQTPLPACGSLLNQPCRASAAPPPEGQLVLARSAAAGMRSETAGGAHGALGLLALLAAALGRRHGAGRGVRCR